MKKIRKPRKLCSEHTSAFVFGSILTLLLLQVMVHVMLDQTYKITVDTRNEVEVLGKRVGALEAGQSAQPLVVLGPVVGDELSLSDKIDIAFMEDASIAKAIVMCESRMHPDRIGDTSLTFVESGVEYGKSYGLFQIRHLPGRPSPDKLLNPDFNIQYAKNMYDKQGWGPWTCGQRKLYERFL